MLRLPSSVVRTRITGLALALGLTSTLAAAQTPVQPDSSRRVAQSALLGTSRRAGAARFRARAEILHFTIRERAPGSSTIDATDEYWIRGGSVLHLHTDASGARTESALLYGVPVERAPDGTVRRLPDRETSRFLGVLGTDPFLPLGGVGEALTPAVSPGIASTARTAFVPCPDASPCVEIRFPTPVTFPSAPTLPGERVSRFRLRDSVLVLTELHSERDTFRLTGSDIRAVYGVPAPSRVTILASRDRAPVEREYADVRYAPEDSTRFPVLPSAVAAAVAQQSVDRAQSMMRGGSPPPAPDLVREMVTVVRTVRGVPGANVVQYDRRTRGADVVVSIADSTGIPRVEAVVGDAQWTRVGQEVRAFVSPSAQVLRAAGTFTPAQMWPWTVEEAPRGVGLADAECELGPCARVLLEGSGGAARDQGWVLVELGGARVMESARVRTAGTRPDTTVLTIGQWTSMGNAIRPALSRLVHADTTWERRLMRVATSAADTMAFQVPVEMRRVP